VWNLLGAQFRAMSGLRGFGDRVAEIDGAGGIFDEDDFEAEVLAVGGGAADAEVAAFS
jgi:hypothetical protein